MNNFIAIFVIATILVFLLGINFGDKIEGKTEIPDKCAIWFDGCNTCSVMSGGQLICTGNVCSDYERQPSRCLEIEQ